MVPAQFEEILAFVDGASSEYQIMIDHLNGRTLFESASPLERIKALREYEAARAAGARPGDVSIDDLKVR